MHGLNFHNCLFVYIMKKLAWLNMPECDAVSFSSQYKQLVPLEQIKSKKKKLGVIIFFLSLGYTESIFKRKRIIPNINHPSPPLRAQAERQAVNFCVQGMSNIWPIYYIVLERKSIQKGNFICDLFCWSKSAVFYTSNKLREWHRLKHFIIWYYCLLLEK